MGKRILNMFAEYLKVDAATIKRDALIDDLLPDEAKKAEMIILLEEEFKVEISDEAFDAVKSVDGLSALIEDLDEIGY